jgi:hypothetical protein
VLLLLLHQCTLSFNADDLFPQFELQLERTFYFLAKGKGRNH